MRIIQYPSIYKHFKGEYYYATMGLSTPIDMSLFDFKVKYINAINTETNKKIIVIISNKGKFVHDENDSKEELVLYKSLYDDTGVYARPINIFLSKVDKEKYPNVKQLYRFELKSKEMEN